MNLLAIDCEMVGDINNQPILAKVSIVNFNLGVVYDSFVRPTADVYDGRDTGFSATQLLNGKSFQQVQDDVLNLIKGNTLIGHSLDADLRALRISHNNKRDVATFEFSSNGERRSLKDLAWELLGKRIQTGRHHDSIEDAQAAMLIYRKRPF